ncbi:hypothetical protein [Algoriphagus confluentis]|uniref:DoxX family protein n=1 Tax=Algoriphagus confluentis TaxID=1697556 RepID=A0ABQ6PU65_9BACT|nr:hypothetical protein Aconfl_29350 [Algoriphagus confluentis]
MKDFSPLNQFLRLWMGIYILLIAFPFPIQYIPILNLLTTYLYDIPKEWVVLFFGQKILGWEDISKIKLTGSGDTTFDYAFLVFAIVSSVLTAGIIFLSKASKSEYSIFYRWTLLYARYFVGLSLFSYGAIKFWNGQFPGPDIGSMEVMYGEMSPMGLAWRFFGYSDTYKFFMGISEISAGLLILFPRTKVFGALLSIGVCLNIVLVNFSFDIPVKIFSSHLLFFSILTVLPFGKSLFELFFLHKPVQLEKERAYFQSKRGKIAWWIVNFFLVGFISFGTLANHLYFQLSYVPTHPWQGFYSEFQTESPFPFERLLIDDKTISWGSESKITQYFVIQKMDEKGLIVFAKSLNEPNINTLEVQETSTGEVLLVLQMDNQTFKAQAKRKRREEYPLIQRGFNLIQEYPYNR